MEQDDPAQDRNEGEERRYSADDGDLADLATMRVQSRSGEIADAHSDSHNNSAPLPQGDYNVSSQTGHRRDGYGDGTDDAYPRHEQRQQPAGHARQARDQEGAHREADHRRDREGDPARVVAHIVSQPRRTDQDRADDRRRRS